MNDERHNTSEVPTDFQWKLIEDITNDFAPDRKIGSGGYGVVYKGLHPNGQEVAVKKLHHMPGLDEDQFQNELRILTRIYHPNVVQLVGKSYIERDRCVEHQGRLVFATMIDRAICLEFLPNGSLDKYLNDERYGLSWQKRYRIIKGICNGLKYLHGKRIFHLDLKPSNILLDKDMEPKIADFGLSRLFSGTRQSHTTKILLCTLGYAPPEFVHKGKITNKFDIFSLGVIIIKVLAGPDSDKSDSQDFIDLVPRKWRETLMDTGWRDASYLDAYCNQVKTCTEIALKCVETNSHKRPSIEDIISMLNETEETIQKLYQQLFVVEPSHLCFPFEPDKLIPCPVHLTNNADHDITYRIQPPNTQDVFVGSLNGIVPARSTQTYVLTMQKQEKPPPNLDIIHIQSAVTNWELLFSIDFMFDNAEVVHDERKVVKITSLYECASQLASKPIIEAELDLSDTIPPLITGGLLKLVYLENRVAFSRLFFPVEAKVAMLIAQADATEEFGGIVAPCTSGDLNETPVAQNKRLRSRINALMKTVELGRRYFPICSQVLDKFLKDDQPDGLDQYFLQRGTADEQKVKRMRFCQLKEDVLKAFSKDKADSSMFSGLSSSSWCSPPQKSIKW